MDKIRFFCSKIIQSLRANHLFNVLYPAPITIISQDTICIVGQEAVFVIVLVTELVARNDLNSLHRLMGRLLRIFLLTIRATHEIICLFVCPLLDGRIQLLFTLLKMVPSVLDQYICLLLVKITHQEVHRGHASSKSAYKYQGITHQFFHLLLLL